METPLVSIVMAAYNEEKHIRDAVESILRQSYRKIEFIIVNDGSTDNTEAIIQSFSDPRIVYIRNEQNLKLIASLNKGLGKATGKYIARMDADDIAYPHRIETQVKFMENNPEVGISGCQLEIFGDTEGTMTYPLHHQEIRLRLMLTSCFGNNAVIMRRDLLNKHRLYFPEGYVHAEDYKSWTSWINHCVTANLSDRLVKYRSHSGSISVKHRKLQRQTRNNIRKEYVTSLFDLSENEASGFTGAPSRKRIRAIDSVLRKNEQLKIFDQKDLQDMCSKIWYSDSLELIEDDFSVFFRFPAIFNLQMGGNLTRWWYLLKHAVKLKLTNR